MATLLQVHYEYSVAVGRKAMMINLYCSKYSLKLRDLFSTSQKILAYLVAMIYIQSHF